MRFADIMLPALSVIAALSRAFLVKRKLPHGESAGAAFLITACCLAGYVVTRSPLTSMYFVTITPFIICIALYFLERFIGEDPPHVKKIAAACRFSRCLFFCFYFQDRCFQPDDIRPVRSW